MKTFKPIPNDLSILNRTYLISDGTKILVNFFERENDTHYTFYGDAVDLSEKKPFFVVDSRNVTRLAQGKNISTLFEGKVVTIKLHNHV